MRTLREIKRRLAERKAIEVTQRGKAEVPVGYVGGILKNNMTVTMRIM